MSTFLSSHHSFLLLHHQNHRKFHSNKIHANIPIITTKTTFFSRPLNTRQRTIINRIEAEKKQPNLLFEELLETSDKPLLVDFYATWCGPCQFMVPILEEVSQKFKEKIEVVKIDTEKNTSIANRYEIEALPTFIIFKDGEPCDRFEGAMPADKLMQRIESILADIQ